jgi:hypothetical protein
MPSQNNFNYASLFQSLKFGSSLTPTWSYFLDVIHAGLRRTQKLPRGLGHPHDRATSRDYDPWRHPQVMSPTPASSTAFNPRDFNTKAFAEQACLLGPGPCACCSGGSASPRTSSPVTSTLGLTEPIALTKQNFHHDGWTIAETAYRGLVDTWDQTIPGYVHPLRKKPGTTSAPSILQQTRADIPTAQQTWPFLNLLDLWRRAPCACCSWGFASWPRLSCIPPPSGPFKIHSLPLLDLDVTRLQLSQVRTPGKGSERISRL